MTARFEVPGVPGRGKLVHVVRLQLGDMLLDGPHEPGADITVLRPFGHRSLAALVVLADEPDSPSAVGWLLEWPPPVGQPLADEPVVGGADFRGRILLPAGQTRCAPDVTR